MIRRLHLAGSPAERGRTHGAAFPDELRGYTDERIALAGSGKWSTHAATTDEMISLAAEMVPAHEQYASDLAAEMHGMAEGGGISVEEAVIVGGFTDFIDVVRHRFGVDVHEDTCTAVIVPASAGAGGAGLLGQTWDMHDTATPYVVMLDVQSGSDPAALVFTTIGCVGQIGMNEAGISIGINNLAARQGQVGVTWPFVVRKVLQQTDLDDAVKCVLDADLAGAHNFLLLDREGRGANIEAMPQTAKVTKVEHEPFVHTNHVVDPALAAHEAERPEALGISSAARLDRARELMGATPVTPEALMNLSRSETVCQVSAPPYHVESCGAAIMRPATGDFWAVWGRPDLNEYEHLRLG